MKTNHEKTRIFLILDEAIAYLHNNSRIKKKEKNQPRKSSIFQQLVAKNWIFSAKFEYFRRNNCVHTKAIAKNQLGIKKKKKGYGKIGAYLRNQFLQKSRTSKKLTMKNVWILPIFGESNVYLHNQSLKKTRVLPIFDRANVFLHNQSWKKVRVLPIFEKANVFLHNQLR